MHHITPAEALVAGLVVLVYGVLRREGTASNWSFFTWRAIVGGALTAIIALISFLKERAANYEPIHRWRHFSVIALSVPVLRAHDIGCG